jgi:hypothetical protein
MSGGAARSSSIPEILEPAVLERAVSGSTCYEIADWLKAAHGVETSYRSVSRLLERLRAERKSLTQAVVREKLGKTVLTDIDRLERLRLQVHRKARALETRWPDDAAAQIEAGWVDLKRLELSVLDRKLKSSGLDDSADAPSIDVSSLSDDQLRQLATGDTSILAGALRVGAPPAHDR